VVIAIITILAAILFPVFAAARAKARQTVCLSNLRQIGLAIDMYAQDYDTLFPFGGDAVDLNQGGWAGTKFEQEVLSMDPLQDILMPYTSSKPIWKCPSDVGLNDDNSNLNWTVSPSVYEVYGNSYGYHTELALRHLSISSVVAYDPTLPYQSHGPSEIDIMEDLSNQWHGSSSAPTYDVLFADGHTSYLTAAQRNASYARDLYWPPNGY
jgi:type II secretory pathway pseudopilin PulG